MYLIKTIA